jgi:hypothetical protein
VVYRKGELSKGTMDRQWPHQVALPATRACLPLCPRTHSFRRNDSAIAIRFLDSSDQCYPLVGEAFA